MSSAAVVIGALWVKFLFFLLWADRVNADRDIKEPVGQLFLVAGLRSAIGRAPDS